MNRVAITGLAPITAMGTGKAFFEHLLKKEAVIRRIPPEYTGAPLSPRWTTSPLAGTFFACPLWHPGMPAQGLRQPCWH